MAAIYAAKGRPAENPSIVHVASAAAAFALAADVPAVAVALAARFWPGPITLVLRARPSQVPTAAAVPDQTALHGAAQRGYTAFVKFLAEHGADLQAKDAAGRTALDLAKGVGVAGVRQAAGEGFPERARPDPQLAGSRLLRLGAVVERELKDDGRAADICEPAEAHRV